jgi:Mg2+ and Co2+ transporter CorA
MTSIRPKATLIADTVGLRPLATADEVRDLVAPLDFFWLDVFCDDSAARAALLAPLGLEASEVLWALRFGQVARMTVVPNGLRVVTWLAEPAGRIVEVHVLCTPRCILTVWDGDPKALDEARRHFADRAGELQKNHFHAAAIVLQLLLATLDQSITVLDTRLHQAQERLRLTPDASEFATLTTQLQQLQSRWANFDRFSSAIRSAIVGVEVVPGMDPLGAAELNDYAEQVEDAEHRLHDRSQWAASILQNHAAAVAHRQADQINRLTLVSMIFLPITFITGFFGMNFGWLSQAIGSATAFVLLGLVLPVLCVTLTVRWMRRRGLM